MVSGEDSCSSLRVLFTLQMSLTTTFLPLKAVCTYARAVGRRGVMSNPAQIQERILMVSAEFDRKILRNAVALMKLTSSDPVNLIYSVDSWLQKSLSPVTGEDTETGDEP